MCASVHERAYVCVCVCTYDYLVWVCVCSSFKRACMHMSERVCMDECVCVCVCVCVISCLFGGALIWFVGSMKLFFRVNLLNYSLIPLISVGSERQVVHNGITSCQGIYYVAFVN